MWQIKLSKQANSFAEQERISDDRVLALVKKFINHTHGQTENLDIKKMKGAWKGYHRVRIGKIRMILRTDVNKHVIFVDRASCKTIKMPSLRRKPESRSP